MSNGNGCTRAGAGDVSDEAIRPAAPPDAHRAAVLHAAGIDEGFLSWLGPRFLTRLYRRVLLHDRSFLIVAEDGGDVVGFVAGSIDLSDLYCEFLAKDGPAVALVAGWKLLLHWRRAFETLRQVRHGDGTVGVLNERHPATEAELLAIAVDPRSRKRGVGSRLVDEFVLAAAALGATSGRVVVASGNDAATTLYRRAGFLPDAEFELHRGTTSLLMRIDPLVGGRPKLPPTDDVPRR